MGATGEGEQDAAGDERLRSMGARHNRGVTSNRCSQGDLINVAMMAAAEAAQGFHPPPSHPKSSQMTHDANVIELQFSLTQRTRLHGDTDGNAFIFFLGRAAEDIYSAS